MKWFVILHGQILIGEQAREQPMNSDAKDFFKLLDEGSEPLWDGCTKHSKLSAVATLLNIKDDHNMSHECFESLLKAIKLEYVAQQREIT